MMSSTADAFHLAWYKLDVPRATEYLVYTLVPAHLRAFKGTLRLRRISYSGIDVGEIVASAYDLASPRSPECPEGKVDPKELELIRHLHVRAARVQIVLPNLVASRTARDWAKLAITAGDRQRLLVSGGR